MKMKRVKNEILFLVKWGASSRWSFGPNGDREDASHFARDEKKNGYRILIHFFVEETLFDHHKNLHPELFLKNHDVIMTILLRSWRQRLEQYRQDGNGIGAV